MPRLENLVDRDRVPERLRSAYDEVAGERQGTVSGPYGVLLHSPEVARDADADELASLERPGAALLRELVETVQAEPTITTAGLLERFRNHTEGRHLGRIAATGVPPDDEFDPSAEFQHCFRQLQGAAQRQRIQYLIEKQKVSGLDEDEKAELRQLGRNPAGNGSR